ncbi:MAG TPA: SPFH domain-containing protein [Bacillota bacterium]|nr:SPFH domain-containing protein [Bacillota bacterium]
MQERSAWKANGFLGILIIVLALGAGAISIILEQVFTGIVLVFTAISLTSGITVIQPNQARALVFFGRYLGTVHQSGLWLTIPFTEKKLVSLRVRNFNSARLKVNDIEGNPIEIAAVVVFKVMDTAKALFDVDDYEKFVEIQSETALRHVATKYPYDIFEEDTYSLRANSEEVSKELAQELQTRLSLAGVEVLEARLTHLAYATEIAGAMLQRQQATAILSARKKIVEGAVGMATMAIEQLQQNGSIRLDDDRKLAMINNIMVSIVSERSAQPVINTGELS